MINQLPRPDQLVCRNDRHLTVSLLCLVVLFTLVFLNNHFNEKVPWLTATAFTRSETAYSGAIATLIRSTNHSVDLTINMIHSISYFYPISYNRLLTIIIFHDENLTSVMQNRIFSCVSKVNHAIRITFAIVDFNYSEALIDPNSLLRYKIGYRIMSKFWSNDIFYHPIIVRSQFDYLMRMDDDSYFSARIEENLFEYMERKRLDYIYRALYSETSEPMSIVLKKFLGTRYEDNKNCIYNNFFVIRLKWFYQSEIIQRFLRELLEGNRMIKEYIGDGCVHAAWLRIDSKTKFERIHNIGYGHNYHTMDINASGFSFQAITQFYNETKKSCNQLTILRQIPARLVRIVL